MEARFGSRPTGRQPPAGPLRSVNAGLLNGLCRIGFVLQFSLFRRRRRALPGPCHAGSAPRPGAPAGVAAVGRDLSLAGHDGSFPSVNEPTIGAPAAAAMHRTMVRGDPPPIGFGPSSGLGMRRTRDGKEALQAGGDRRHAVAGGGPARPGQVTGRRQSVVRSPLSHHALNGEGLVAEQAYRGGHAARSGSRPRSPTRRCRCRDRPWEIGPGRSALGDRIAIEHAVDPRPPDRRPAR